MGSIGKVFMLIGADACGKTENVCSFQEEIAILDIDDKAQNTIEEHYPNKLITVYKCIQYHKKSDKVLGVKRGDIDIDETVKSIESSVIDILDNFERFETVVIDSVSDLNRIYTDHWIKHDPKNRGFISETNIKARADINSRIKDNVLFPLVHITRELNKVLIMTSKVKNAYTLIDGDDGVKHNVKTGEKEPDCKDFIPYKLDGKFSLTNNEKLGKYYVTWNRTLVPGLKGTEEITGKKLFDVFIDKGVLK